MALEILRKRFYPVEAPVNWHTWIRRAWSGNRALWSSKLQLARTISKVLRPASAAVSIPLHRKYISLLGDYLFSWVLPLFLLVCGLPLVASSMLAHFSQPVCTSREPLTLATDVSYCKPVTEGVLLDKLSKSRKHLIRNGTVPLPSKTSRFFRCHICNTETNWESSSSFIISRVP